MGDIDFSKVVTAEERAKAARAKIEAGVRAEAGRRLDALAGGYSPQERGTFAAQATEAGAVLTDAGAPAPFLSVLAAARGVEVKHLAQKIAAKADALGAASAAVLGAQAALLAREEIPADFRDDRHWPGQDPA